MGSVYLITNLVNGKQYVGQTTRDPMWRWGEYKRDRGRGMVSRAIIKHGAANFQFEILITGVVDQYLLDQCEIYYIRMYSTLVPHGYNLLIGGFGLGRAAARGDRNGSRTHPERMARGDKHWTRLYPEQLKRGEHNHMSKLTTHQVHAIIYLYCSRWSYKQIAALFQVSISQVSRIVHQESRVLG